MEDYVLVDCDQPLGVVCAKCGIQLVCEVGMNSWDEERSENKTQTHIIDDRNKLFVHDYNSPKQLICGWEDA